MVRFVGVFGKAIAGIINPKSLIGMLCIDDEGGTIDASNLPGFRLRTCTIRSGQSVLRVMTHCDFFRKLPATRLQSKDLLSIRLTT